MNLKISNYIYQYLNDCDYNYKLYDLVSSVEIEFNIPFTRAFKYVTAELHQLGEQ